MKSAINIESVTRRATHFKSWRDHGREVGVHDFPFSQNISFSLMLCTKYLCDYKKLKKKKKKLKNKQKKAVITKSSLGIKKRKSANTSLLHAHAQALIRDTDTYMKGD